MGGVGGGKRGTTEHMALKWKGLLETLYAKKEGDFFAPEGTRFEDPQMKRQKDDAGRRYPPFFAFVCVLKMIEITKASARK